MALSAFPQFILSSCVVCRVLVLLINIISSFLTECSFVFHKLSLLLGGFRKISIFCRLQQIIKTHKLKSANYKLAEVIKKLKNNTWLGLEAYSQPLCFTLVVGWY